MQEPSDEPINAFRLCLEDTWKQLQTDLPSAEILATILAPPLEYLRTHTSSLSASKSSAIYVDLHRLLPRIQELILQSIVPTWLHALDDKQASLLVDYFCPPITESTQSHGHASFIAAHGYCSLLSLPLTQYSILLLDKLVAQYSIDSCYHAIYGANNNNIALSVKGLFWEDCVKALLTLPAKVLNFSRGEEPSKQMIST